MLLCDRGTYSPSWRAFHPLAITEILALPAPVRLDGILLECGRLFTHVTMADLLPEPPVGYQPTSIMRVTLVADETT